MCVILSSLPCIVLVNNQLCPHRKLKRRRTRRSKNPPGGGGPSRRACPSQCLSAILGMGRKTIQERPKMDPGLRQSSPAARLCLHHRETVLKAAEVLLCPLQKTLCHHSPPLDSCAMPRRGSPKEKAKSSKVCETEMWWLQQQCFLFQCYWSWLLLFRFRGDKWGLISRKT